MPPVPERKSVQLAIFYPGYRNNKLRGLINNKNEK